MAISFPSCRIFVTEDQLNDIITCCYRVVTEIREYQIIDGHDDESHAHFCIYDTDNDLYLLLDPPTFMEVLARCLCRDYSIDDIYDHIGLLMHEGYEDLKNISQDFEPTVEEKKILQFFVDPCKEEE